jgi:hypothetical protein
VARDIDEVARNYRFFVRQYSDGRAAEPDERRVRQWSRRHRAAIARTQDVCARAMTVLRQHRVDGGSIPLYVAYVQRLDRAQRRYSRQTLANEVRALTRHWTARGLDEAVLEAVRGQVFDGAAPTP